MFSKVFTIYEPCKIEGDLFSVRKAFYRVPTLPAYSVEYSELRVYQNLDGSNRTELLQGEGFELEDDLVIWDSYVNKIAGIETPIHLIIHYHGIRDYCALFPRIENDEMRIRLATYYEEAEKNYESGAWLSFILMCGAIFEGLLYDFLDEENRDEKERKKRNFSNYIKDALSREGITEIEKDVMFKLRDQRNLVHLGRFKTPYISRKQAIDTRKVLDDMIIRFSIPQET